MTELYPPQKAAVEKLVEALRTDDWTMNAADVEQQLRAIEEVLTL